MNTAYLIYVAMIGLLFVGFALGILFEYFRKR